MVQRNYKHLTPEVLHSVVPATPEEAEAVATAPGGIRGSGYPLFVELTERPELQLEAGSHACLEFVLPGRPGRWRASGQVTLALAEKTATLARGVFLEVEGLVLTQDVAAPVEAEEPEAVDFDASEITIEAEAVAGMLADLLGRDVAAGEPGSLADEVPDDALVATFCNEEGQARCAVVLDKAAAAWVGGALTMLAPDELAAQVEAEGPLEGDPLTNATEVLNIMSALFHEAGAPHLVLGQAASHGELRAGGDHALLTLLDSPAWSLGLGLDVEEYGQGAALLLAL